MSAHLCNPLHLKEVACKIKWEQYPILAGSMIMHNLLRLGKVANEICNRYWPDHWNNIVDPRKNGPKQFELAKYFVQCRLWQANRAPLKMNVQRLAGALLAPAGPTSGYHFDKGTLVLVSAFFGHRRHCHQMIFGPHFTMYTEAGFLSINCFHSSSNRLLFNRLRMATKSPETGTDMDKIPQSTSSG